MRAARDVIIAQRSAYLSEHDADGSLVRFWVALRRRSSEHRGGEGIDGVVIVHAAAESSMVWMEFARWNESAPASSRRGVYRRALGRVSDPGHAAALHNSFLEFEVKEGTPAPGGRGGDARYG